MYRMRRQFVTFLAVGAAAAALNWTSRIALSRLLPLGTAVVLAHCVGMVFAYLAFRSLAFRVDGAVSMLEAGRFMLVNVVSLTQTWVITIGLQRLVLAPMGLAEPWTACAHALAIGSTAVSSFLLHRYFTFAAADRKAE